MEGKMSTWYAYNAANGTLNGVIDPGLMVIVFGALITLCIIAGGVELVKKWRGK